MDAISADPELEALLSQWSDNAQQTPKAFHHLRAHLTRKPDLTFQFVARPGVSYSLRVKHRRQIQHPLFAMIDIIDDDPDERWLSVCFFGEMISDPDEVGDFVPEGLLGQDAHCFDIEAWDEDRVAYVMARLDEAYDKASQDH